MKLNRRHLEKKNLENSVSFADTQSPMVLVYSCQPAVDSSGNYYLPEGTSSYSSAVTFRLSVSIHHPHHHCALCSNRVVSHCMSLLWRCLFTTKVDTPQLYTAHTYIHCTCCTSNLELTAICCVKLRLSLSLSTFKSRLKTHLFSTAFC